MTVGRHRLDEQGAAAAEFAVVLPAIVLVVLFGVGALAAGARQVRLQDAVADAARVVARGDDPGKAHALVASVGGTAEVEDRGDLVCVNARAPSTVPFLPDVWASSCALAGGL